MKHFLRYQLLFVVLYAFTITIITYLFNVAETYLPEGYSAIEKIEDGFYDKIKYWLVVNDENDLSNGLKTALDKIAIINLDKEVFDSHKSKYNTNLLATKINLLAKSRANCFFIDILFSRNIEDKNDSLFMKSLENLQREKKLVMPIHVKKEPYVDTINSQYIGRIEHLAMAQFVGANVGEKIRKFDSSLGNCKSVPLELFSLTDSSKSFNVDETIEVNYLIGKKILRKNSLKFSTLDSINVKQLANKEIVFIGTQEDYQDNQGNNIDQHLTPVAMGVFGIEIMVNSYLNLKLNCWIKKAPYEHVFLVNLAITLLLVAFFSFYQKYNKIPTPNFVISIGYFLFTFILWIITAYFFLAYKHIEIYVLVPLLGNQKIKNLYQLYQSYFITK